MNRAVAKTAFLDSGFMTWSSANGNSAEAVPFDGLTTSARAGAPRTGLRTYESGLAEPELVALGGGLELFRGLHHAGWVSRQGPIRGRDRHSLTRPQSQWDGSVTPNR